MTTATDPRLLRGQRQLEAERCRRSAHALIFDAGQLHTRDEHDAKNPVKPVPDVPYLRVLLDCFLVSGRQMSPEDATHARRAGLPLAWLARLGATGMLLVEKSRDVFVTNIVCTYLLWRVRALAHQLVLVQSKKEEDAAKLVFVKEPQFGRMSFMEDHLPSHLRQLSWPGSGAYGNLYCPNGSHVRAIPEGGDIIRSEHPSVIFCDEAAFQPEFGASFTAALPACEGGGQYLAVSSANPSEWETIVAAEQATEPTAIPGLGYRLAGGTIPVLRLHYAADPAKRPGTEAGETWRARAAERYPGGIVSPRWRQEMEIEYRAFSGLKVIPQAEAWLVGPPIVIPSFAADGYRLYASYDHGWTNPAAFHVHGIDGDGGKVTLWELYADRVPVNAIARIMKGEDVVTPPRPDAAIDPGRVRFPGCPYAGAFSPPIADPSLWAEDQPMNDGPNKSIAWLFQRHGVVLQKGERGGDGTVAEWLLGDLWADPRHPLYRITRACPWLIRELHGLRYKQLAAHVATSKNVPEEIVDKDNHAWDGLNMFLKKSPPAASKPRPEERGGSFMWFREQQKRAQTGRPVQSFRRAMVG